MTTPSGIDIRCPKCGWDPPPFAMERHGRREADGTWSLVCPRDGTVIMENIRYADDGRGPRTIDIARDLPPRRERRRRRPS